MTQLEHADRRTTVLMSAAVSALIALAITVSSALVLSGVATTPGTISGGGGDPRVERLEQAEREWQARYEQMYPDR